uniref:Peptidase S1 domain-containing protein n=1 Tax=Strigamia maritima TaxID=126957 RepID=T1IUY1_STRMM
MFRLHILLICLGCSGVIPITRSQRIFQEDDVAIQDRRGSFLDRTRKFVGLFNSMMGGVPDYCFVGGKKHSCQFFLMCLVSGGEPQDGCGNNFLYRCCPPRGHNNGAPVHSSNAISPAVAPIPPGFRPNGGFGNVPPFQAGPNFPGPTQGFLPPMGPVINDPRCGQRRPLFRSDIAQDRIVGGNDAGFAEFPWMAFIRIGASRCGGSLVNQMHVVTAGHCVARLVLDCPRPVPTPMGLFHPPCRASPGQVTVILGDYILSTEIEPLQAESFAVTTVRVHPNFQFTPEADRFDVAVLRLDRPVMYKPHISPICIPFKNENFEGMVGYVAGWGATEAGSSVRPRALQVVDVPIIPNHVCESWHRQKGIRVTIHGEMVCAGYQNGGKDSCQGDSGGPLMVNKNGIWFLVGLVSAGYSCAQRFQPARIFPQLLGLPSTCYYEGAQYRCTFFLFCWLGGGRFVNSCGASWVFTCCVPKSTQSRTDLIITNGPVINNLKCGMQIAPFSDRIIGGEIARGSTEFPWIAHVKINGFQCGGALVNNFFVVTAAHCVRNARLGAITVVLGAFDLQDKKPTSNAVYGVVEKRLHPNFQYMLTQPDRFDVALLRLNRQVDLQNNIRPICLPNSGRSAEGSLAVVAGWGKIDNAPGSRTGTNILQKVAVPVVSNAECVGWHAEKGIELQLYAEMLCAGYRDGNRDACLGDSGGPLMTLDNGRWTLIGITSAGFGCAVDRQPGIYHRVATTAAWISSNIN